MSVQRREVRLFNCADWQKADARTRGRVVDQIRGFVGGRVAGQGPTGRGAIIPDEQAHRLFDNYCAQGYARGFQLYRLYANAAGFGGVAP